MVGKQSANLKQQKCEAAADLIRVAADRGLSEQEFADLIGVKEATVERWRRGYVPLPARATIAKATHALKTGGWVPFLGKGEAPSNFIPPPLGEEMNFLPLGVPGIDAVRETTANGTAPPATAAAAVGTSDLATWAGMALEMVSTELLLAEVSRRIGGEPCS